MNEYAILELNIKSIEAFQTNQPLQQQHFSQYTSATHTDCHAIKTTTRFKTVSTLIFNVQWSKLSCLDRCYTVDDGELTIPLVNLVYCVSMILMQLVVSWQPERWLKYVDNTEDTMLAKRCLWGRCSAEVNIVESWGVDSTVEELRWTWGNNFFVASQLMPAVEICEVCSVQCAVCSVM